MSSGASAVGLSVMGEADYHGERLLDAVAGVLPGWRVSCEQHAGRLGACRLLVEVLDRLPGATLQDRWEAFEEGVWPAWGAGRERPEHHHWSYGIWTLVMARAVRPGWPVLNAFAPGKWLWPLPLDDPLRAAAAQLGETTAQVAWSNARMRAGAGALGLRIMLARVTDRWRRSRRPICRTPHRSSASAGSTRSTRRCARSGFWSARPSAARPASSGSRGPRRAS